MPPPMRAPPRPPPVTWLVSRPAPSSKLMARFYAARAVRAVCRYAPDVTPGADSSGLTIPMGEGADDAARLRACAA